MPCMQHLLCCMCDYALYATSAVLYVWLCLVCNIGCVVCVTMPCMQPAVLYVWLCLVCNVCCVVCVTVPCVQHRLCCMCDYALYATSAVLYVWPCHQCSRRWTRLGVSTTLPAQSVTANSTRSKYAVRLLKYVRHVAHELISCISLS